ncbi:protein unc-13 homolog 4B isoform X2 [Onthophagus taurus]|uniref:protein unc-13 homolog 4B isoform X2 n=1 Tax=Onthophagus taurus TaxID=166361 RepID=UPI0039BDF572
MSEDFMIRAFENYQRHDSVEQEEHDKRIQEIDGGFFETFGHLFREKSIYAAAKEKQEKETVAKEAADLEAVIENVPEIAETEEIPSSSDSEPEDQTLYISTALNIDELYVEMLYVIIHNVGCDVNYEVGQTALLSYIQDAFKIDNRKHQDLFDIAQKKEPPEMLLNIEVIEAKDLVSKDPNGLADPFVTLYLASNSSQRYNSSVKPTTLSPVWEEHFALPVPENPSDDTLCLEVWDFDPAETVGEKFGKFFDVKGVRGMRRLVKEIAVTATSGQHRNELIGRAQIPLSAIPASGMTMWYSLDKKNKITRQGVIKVRIAFSSEKNVHVAAQEHKHLLRILLLHELETSKVAPFWWCGSFSPQGNALITQHVAQSGLSTPDIALAQWIVYTNVHRTHPLSFDLFVDILEKLCKPIQYNSFEEEDLKLFWDATKKLIPTCLSMIRKIRKTNFKEKNQLKQVAKVLNVLGLISMLDPPENINELLENCVVKGAKDWFEHILENTQLVEDSDEAKMKRLVKIVQLVRTDLQKAIEYYDKMFHESLNFKYAKELYKIYQNKLTDLIEPEVKHVSETMARMPHVGFTNIKQVDTNQPMVVGTTLFELYLYIQRFVILGTDLCPTEHETFEIKNFYVWFYSAVAQWLDIALYKALQRIDKAVSLDKLVPVDAEMKISSSAIDSLSIFYQIKVFWQELNWPDVEGSYTFIAKIIDDICRCCVYYADRVSDAVEGMGDIKDVYEQRFQVTNEWCLAINNIDYVLQHLIPFTKEMEMEKIIEKLGDIKSPLEAQRCQHTLDTVIVNAVDTVKNKIIELLETVAEKMTPSMKRLLIEGAELFQQDCNSIDKVMRYLDDNLHTLHDQLNEENFSRILDIIFIYLNNILTDLIQSNLEKRRPPSFFSNLHETLKLMKHSFKLNDTEEECEQLKKTEHLLYLNGLETSELIHQVHLDLWKEQEKKDSNLGQLTIKCKFDNCELKIEVLNGKNLVAMDSNGSTDSFVRIHLLPEDKFTNVTKPKTQTQHKTLFPLYDEHFTLKLTTDQRNLENGLILFSCKDYDMLGYNNQYIGEAFMHFKDVPSNGVNSQQLVLYLHRPKTLDTDALKALEYRQGDKQAKEFLRRFKMRMNSPKSS